MMEYLSGQCGRERVKSGNFQTFSLMDRERGIIRALGAAVIVLCLIIIGMLVTSPAAVPTQNGTGIMYQLSTIGSLMNGGFTGVGTVADLHQHGDFGLGTYDGLDGEMVMVDGSCYQILSTGNVRLAGDNQTTPFATVTRFQIIRTTPALYTVNLTDLTGSLDRTAGCSGTFCAARLDGTFPYVKARSPRKQGKPYPNLTEALKTQSVFEFRNMTGTMVGIYTPSWASSLNVPGWQLHFITQDRTGGGHVLDCMVNGTDAEIDPTVNFFLTTPENPGTSPELAEGMAASLDRAERSG
jgi:acetolactate decarboxylase